MSQIKGYGSESKRLILCQNSMQLWYSLQVIGIHQFQDREPTREEWKAAVSSYPFDTEKCRCKLCRYHRLSRKVK